MGNIIKVSCPKCSCNILLDKQELAAKQGKAQCPKCKHAFRLVKKRKPQPNAPIQPQRPIRAVVGNRHVAPKGGEAKADVSQNRMHKTVEPVRNAPPRERKTVAQWQEKYGVREPLNYRIPKAEEKPLREAALKNRPFAQMDDKQQFAFNLMEAERTDKQFPQVVEPSSDSGSLFAPVGGGEQQNKITIRTDNLVFTLVGDNPTANLPQQGHYYHEPSAPLPHIQHQNETNWTIATIAALAVLMMQLFYWMLMIL